MIFYQPLTLLTYLGGPGWATETTYQVQVAYWAPHWFDC